MNYLMRSSLVKIKRDLRQNKIRYFVKWLILLCIIIILWSIAVIIANNLEILGVEKDALENADHVFNIIGPIIGLFSAALVYITITEQIRANKMINNIQKRQMEIEDIRIKLEAFSQAKLQISSTRTVSMYLEDVSGKFEEEIIKYLSRRKLIYDFELESFSNHLRKTNVYLHAYLLGAICKFGVKIITDLDILYRVVNYHKDKVDEKTHYTVILIDVCRQYEELLSLLDCIHRIFSAEIEVRKNLTMDQGMKESYERIVKTNIAQCDVKKNILAPRFSEMNEELSKTFIFIIDENQDIK